MVLDAHRAAAVLFENGRHDLLVDLVETEAVHVEQIQGGLRHGLGDASIRPYLRIVADAAQQAVGDARRPAATARDLFRGGVLNLHMQQLRGTVHDGLQLDYLVGVETQHQSEPSAQWSADQALPRGGADGGELRHGQRVGSRARSRTHQNIHAEIFQRGVEHLLHVRQQAMDFVDEEDLARANVAQDAGEVELLL